MGGPNALSPPPVSRAAATAPAPPPGAEGKPARASFGNVWEVSCLLPDASWEVRLNLFRFKVEHDILWMDLAPLGNHVTPFLARVQPPLEKWQGPNLDDETP